jgi:hypothetical protein
MNRLSDPKEFAQAYADLIDKGFYPGSDKRQAAKGITGAAGEMARLLSMTQDGVRRRLVTARHKGFGGIVDAAERRYWDRQKSGDDKQKQPARPPDDIVAEHRLVSDVRRLKAEKKDLLDRIVELQDLRGTVMQLSAAVEAPDIIPPAQGSKTGGKRTAILHISDVHAGEDVSLYEMDGLNSYNAQICRDRMHRLFQKAGSLLTEHWAGDPVEEIVICLGGDMIDNNLREESRRGGSMPVIESVKLISEIIAGGLVYLRNTVGCPMRVYTSPGNHGRLTPKPHIVEGNIDNFDILVSWSVEKIIGAQDWVNFYYTGSGEALFNVYGWWFLLRHGHEGAGGTGGLYGAVYKQVRGMYRAQTSYARRGRGFHWVLQGHDHTHSAIPFGFANGSVVGYNAYAMRKLQADPSPPVQNLLIVEARHGVIAPLPLYLGSPEEGTLYEPPAIDPSATGKPFRRVKAGSKPL